MQDVVSTPPARTEAPEGPPAPGDSSTTAPAAGGITPAVGPVVPRHVAIIMDGNGRWAAQRGLPRIEGHEQGTENIRRITRAAGAAGIRYLTLWAFSTENWRRPADEVSGILRILGEVLGREVEELHDQGAQLRHIGSLTELPGATREAILDAIDRTKHNDRLVLTLAFNYGGRQELLHAVRSLLAAGIDPTDLDEQTLRQHLYTGDVPDPDLVIRTSGEHRMSNFLLWQAAYAEFFFTPVLWPDFGPDDLRCALDDYARRERRFGHVSASTAPGS
ncbi:MAG: di-trans,poly-cis-decaprenylcistransferase [Chloroflexia bacterium]|nr:di-trans,poly-cis-decaprenylcistransferase [Chloroflexia bacterium]